MNYSNRVHWWAKATLASLVLSLVTSIVWFFPLPWVVHFLPSVGWLTTAFAWYYWMNLAEAEQEAFEANEPELSKEIE